MKRNRLILWILTALSSVLLSLPFLVPHCGFLALAGFVPLLCADRIASATDTRHFWIWHYSCFLLWNLISTFWVCFSTVGGGLFASFANALQMSLIFGLFRVSKRRFKGVLPYIFLVFAWLAWEHLYYDAQISWPWIVLGNAFARSIRSIQWYEFTGVLGGSLWIWTANLAVFGLMVSFADDLWGRWNRKAKASAAAGLLLLIAGPFVLSSVIWHNYEEVEDPVEVLVLQPNIDPYQKFEQLTQEEQNEIAFAQIEEIFPDSTSFDSPTLILTPETFANDVITNDWKLSRSLTAYAEMLGRHRNANLLFGASSYDYVYSREAPDRLARKVGNGVWLVSHNSAMIMDASNRPEICHKSKLVVGVEMIPYPALFEPIDRALGGVMGRCVGQSEVSNLNMRSADGDSLIPVGCAICYESVYGDYCTGYARKGARLLTVMTNDAWWGDTPGYHQHLSYASLRAIENRRSLARSANTGISALINQRGEIIARTSWWEKETLHGTLNLNGKMTFFTRHGDYIGKIATFIAALMTLALLVRLVINRSRKK